MYVFGLFVCEYVVPVWLVVCGFANPKDTHVRWPSTAACICRRPQGQPSNCTGTQVEQASGDWRAFRAALVAQEGLDGGARLADNRAAQDWVHPIALPERGCLVLARLPDMEPAFADAVIFLLECGAASRGLHAAC